MFCAVLSLRVTVSLGPLGGYRQHDGAVRLMAGVGSLGARGRHGRIGGGQQTLGIAVQRAAIALPLPGAGVRGERRRKRSS